MSGLPNWLIELSGWIPALVFPLGTWIQFSRLKPGMAKHMSALTWALFGLANLCLFIFAQKWFSIQAILGLLGTAVLDLLIVVKIIWDRKKEPVSES